VFRPADLHSVTLVMAVGNVPVARRPYLFDRPGRFLLRCAYVTMGDHDHPVASAEIPVDVREPAGDDARAWAFLQRHPEAVPALLGVLDAPSRDTLDTAEAIRRNFPRSTYADYARLAIARYHWGSNGAWPLNIYQTVDPAARASTVAALSEIDAPDFPYRPNALILLLRALDETDPKRSAAIEPELRESWADSAEYVNYAATRMPWRDWIRLRLAHQPTTAPTK